MPTSVTSSSSDSITVIGPTVFDLSGRTQIELQGVDRSKFLHGFCTNEIKSLQPGQGCEAFLTNIKGRVLGHVFVFADTESLWLDTVPGQETALIAHLDRYVIREDVQLVGRSSSHGELFITGTHAAALLMLDDGLPPYGSTSRTDLEHPLQIRRVDLLGMPGFQISLPRDAVDSTRSRLVAVGCRAGTDDEFETRRIEAGFPYFGVDFTEDQIAQEVARTSRCISFTKGCYLGQEPIARLDAMGHTNRELRRIRFQPGVVPQRGAKLLAAESDDEAGEITSVAPLPNARGETTCLGYLKTKFGRPDTAVRIATNEQRAMGTVLEVV
jgi:folate-binding protein YgfZ